MIVREGSGHALLFSLEEIRTTIIAAKPESLVIIQRRVAGLTEAELGKFLSRTRRAARLRGEVNLLVTTSRKLRALNYRFRKVNKPTDVLTFPAPPDLSPGFAGDVAISAEIAASNAHRLGHSVAEEIKVLSLHAVLHLAGYDHEHDNGEMERKEARLRKLLRLPVGLIERSGRPDRGPRPTSHKRKATGPVRVRASRGGTKGPRQ